MSLDPSFGMDVSAARMAPARARDTRSEDVSGDRESFRSYFDRASKADERPAAPERPEPKAEPATRISESRALETTDTAASETQSDASGEAPVETDASVLPQGGETNAAATGEARVIASAQQASAAEPVSEAVTLTVDAEIDLPDMPVLIAEPDGVAQPVETAQTSQTSQTTQTPAAADPTLLSAQGTTAQATQVAATGPKTAKAGAAKTDAASNETSASQQADDVEADASALALPTQAARPEQPVAFTVAAFTADAPAAPQAAPVQAANTPALDAAPSLKGPDAATGDAMDATNTSPNPAAPTPATQGAKPAAASPAQAVDSSAATATAPQAAAAAPAPSDPSSFANMLQAATNTPATQTASTPGTATSASALPAPPPEAAVQVSSRIIERFDGQAQRFEMRLDPEELGRVHVRIEIGADKRVHAVLAAHDSAALGDLMRGRQQLEQALASAGLDLADDGLRFELAQDNSNGQGFFGRDNTDGESAQRAPVRASQVYVAPVDAETAAVLRPTRYGASRVNLVA